MIRQSSKTQKFLLCAAAVITAAASVYAAPFANAVQVLQSANYQIVNPEFSAGGGSASSTNYSANATIGNSDTGSSASTNYNGIFGFLFQAYPGIPGTPTLTNTGGNLYNSLAFVITTGNNKSDVNYAIAISSNSFTTTQYIQANDTIGTSAVWQTYTAWGGATGQTITGLSPSTTYQIKVKARYGVNTESGFSTAASAATVAPNITFTISGVSLGTLVAGVTTTISTTAGAMSFATLPVGSSVIAAQQITTTTNATGGYTTTIFQNNNLKSSTGNTIAAVSASNASPAAWPTSVTTGEFGYHTTDATLCTGTLTRFASNNTYAALTSTPTEVACNTVPVSAETTSLVYQLQIGSLQQAGTYSNTITYITTAVY